MMKQATHIPDFTSDEEEAEYWDTHSTADIMDEGEAVELDVSELRAKRERRMAKQVCLRFDMGILGRTKNRAKALGVPYQTLIQLWIAERLEVEESRLQKAS
jgi:predicted DNA binding CopG/RHH family protein